MRPQASSRGCETGRIIGASEIRLFEIASATDYGHPSITGSFLPNLFVDISDNWDLKKEALNTFCILLAPFAPHIAEEIWHLLGFKNSVHKEKWPSFNSEAVKEDNYQLVIQVNGKVRDRINVNHQMEDDQIKKIVLERSNILKWIKNKQIKKIIIVKGKIMNIVI